MWIFYARSASSSNNAWVRHSLSLCVISVNARAWLVTVKETERVQVSKRNYFCCCFFLIVFDQWENFCELPAMLLLAVVKCKKTVLLLNNTNPLNTGGMPMAALRDRLDLASLLFLSCIYKHEPSCLVQYSSYTLVCLYVLWVRLEYSTYSVWRYAKNPASVLNGQLGEALMSLYCIYWLRQF